MIRNVFGRRETTYPAGGTLLAAHTVADASTAAASRPGLDRQRFIETKTLGTTKRDGGIDGRSRRVEYESAAYRAELLHLWSNCEPS